MTQVTREEYYALHGDKGANEANTTEWLRRVNPLLAEAAAEGINCPPDQVSHNPVASGYRPPDVNARTANAAAKSTHTTCEAGDLQDTIGTRLLARFCLRDNCAMLIKHDLYMEDPRWTAGRTNSDPWVHLQTRAPGSGHRVYIPYADTVKNPPQSPPLLPEQKV